MRGTARRPPTEHGNRRLRRCGSGWRLIEGAGSRFTGWMQRCTGIWPRDWRNPGAARPGSQDRRMADGPGRRRFDSELRVTTPLFRPVNSPRKFRKSVKSLHFRLFYSPEQPLICPDERDTMRHSWMYIGLHPFRLHVVYCVA